MTPTQFRRVALGMTGAVEGSHMNHPDFRVNGRIFATIAPDHRRGMVKLTPDQQAEFMRSSPAMFEPAAGAWGRQGCTMVRFAEADEETVGEAITLAWRAATMAAAGRRTRRPPRRRQASGMGRSSKRPGGRPRGR